MRRAVPGLLACVVACTEPGQLAQSLDDLSTLTARARERGAYRCAPEELALSEAHLEFARHELEQGHAARAREHLVLARANASAALRLSSGACAEPAERAPARDAAARETGPRTRSARHETFIKEDHVSI